MKISSKLNELKPSDLNCNVFDVYTYDGLSMQDLLCQFFTKINECIKVSNDTIDLASWLVNEGLKIEVVNKLMLWLEDGTLENLINVNLFNTLHTKIENINTQLAHNENVNFNSVNVKDFLKDNENFSSALNSAIEYCKTNTCKRIVIPDGEYVLSETVYLYDYIEIYGASSTGTVITCDVKTNNFAFEGDTGAYRFKLSNLTLIASESKRGLINGIDCKNQRYSNINNCNLRYFNTAISFDGSCWANYIEYCRFWNNTTSIDFNRTEDLEEANHVNIRSNEFYDTDTAINNPSGRNVNIISNLFERVKCCVYVGNRLRPIVISQNYFESIENAITVSKGDSTKTIIVNENYFEDYNKNDNILIKIEQTSSSQPTIKYLTLNNNFFHSNSSNVKELISVNDYYIVDFYENTFASVNNKPIGYYLDLFTTDSTNIPVKHSKFAPGRTDLNILNLSEVLPSTLATRDRNYNCVLKSISSRDNRGMLHLIMRFNVNSFNDDILIPSSISPYTSTERVGNVIYNDNTCGIVRVQVGSDGYIRIRGYDSSKTIKTVDIDLTYGNSGTGSY